MDNQLLQNYSEAEKTAYLSAIASLATADREASQAEGQFLQAMAQQAGLSASSTQQVMQAAQSADNQTIKQNLDMLKSSDLRFSLVTDLISFARADGSYANDEEAMVTKMASYLNINPAQQHTLENVWTRPPGCNTTRRTPPSRASSTTSAKSFPAWAFPKTR